MHGGSWAVRNMNIVGEHCYLIALQAFEQLRRNLSRRLHSLIPDILIVSPFIFDTHTYYFIPLKCET